MELPSVRCTANRETCIALSVTHGKVICVTLRTGTVDIEKLSIAQFKAQFSFALDYPVRLAVRRFLAKPVGQYPPHTLEVQPAAERALRPLLHA